MDKIELKEKLYQDGLLSVYDSDGNEKRYIDGELLIKNGVRQNKTNVFGIYKSASGKFVFFITENERGGIASYISLFDTEDEACNALHTKIARLKRIQDKKRL